MDQRKRILLTAFKPWGNHKHNLTQELAEDLRAVLEQRGVEIVVLDTLYDAVDRFMNGLNKDRYSHIISMGIMGQTEPPIRFEHFARQCTFKKDDSGITPIFKESAAQEYKADPRLITLRDALEQRGHNIGTSTQAGEYLCEYLYFRILERISNTNTGAIFIHISNTDLDSKKNFLLDYLDALQSMDNPSVNMLEL